jgi:hypothetical protein
MLLEKRDQKGSVHSCLQVLLPFLASFLPRAATTSVATLCQTLRRGQSRSKLLPQMRALECFWPLHASMDVESV